MKSDKPTVSEIKTVFEHLNTTVYGNLFRQFDKEQQFYECAFKELLNIPAEFRHEATVLPTARDMVDTFVDHISLSNARVMVNKKGVTNQKNEAAEMGRKFGLGMLYRTNVESDISPWRVAGKHFANHGLGVIKDVWDADIFPGKPKKKRGEAEDAYGIRVSEWVDKPDYSLPISLLAIHPRNILPDPSYTGRDYIYEHHKKLRFGAWQTFPDLKDKLAGKPEDEVDYISFWTKDWRCDLIDGIPVFGKEVVGHNYGFIPYTLIESGLGNHSIENDPAMRYVGILRYIFDLLVSESKGHSITDVVLMRESMKGGYITGADAEAIGKISQEYGKYTPVGDKDVEFHDWEAKPPPEMLQYHLARMHDMISAHAAPRSLRGMGESNVRSAVDRNMVISQAMKKYQYAEDAFKFGAAKVLENCARIYKHVVPKDARLWARGSSVADEFDQVIKRDDLKEPMNFYVEFAPIAEEDEYRRHDDLERLFKSGISTKRWTRERITDIDPDAMEEQEMVEIVKSTQAYQQSLESLVAYRMQSEIQLLLPPPPQGQPPQGQPQEPGRRVVPESSPKPAPGSAEFIQNQIAAGRRPPMDNQGQGGGGNNR